jgi:putative DNA primase/helicase
LPEALDADQWLLNVLNGTIDLRTGKLLAHRREDLITKLAPVEFHPDAECPKWMQFLADIFRGNSELAEFVQRLLGYCLTGDVSEQVLPIFHGSGQNGKSTLLTVILDLLGEDYAIQAASDLLLTKKQEHPTEKADLHGKRLVACVETGEGRRLAESWVKQATGGEKIRARRMREDYWQFDPTHKLILATNHRPEIRGTDYAIWRRVLLVPFEVKIPKDERDKRMAEKLKAEGPEILAWAVRGCLDWQRQRGLGEPDVVTAATQSYREDEDLLAAFIADRCETGPGRVRAGELYQAYRDWAESAGERPMSQKRFGAAMTEREHERSRSGGVWYEGITLLADE